MLQVDEFEYRATREILKLSIFLMDQVPQGHSLSNVTGKMKSRGHPVQTYAQIIGSQLVLNITKRDHPSLRMRMIEVINANLKYSNSIAMYA